MLPGVGLLWFVVRREWSHLAWALGATAILVVATVAIGGIGPWVTWAQHLAGTPDYGAQNAGLAIPLPLILRFPVAIAVVTWGALGNRRWTVPLAATLALPVLWLHGLALLVGVIPLVRESRARQDEAEGPVGAALACEDVGRPAEAGCVGS